MSSPDFVNPQVEIIKEKASELGERVADRHDPDLVSQFVQFSLGVSSLNRLFGETVDITMVMRSGANLAASNLYPDTREQVASVLLGDEELCQEILVTELELIARGDGSATPLE